MVVATDLDPDPVAQRDTKETDTRDPLIVTIETITTGTEEDGNLVDLEAWKGLFSLKDKKPNLRKRENLGLTLPCTRKECNFLNRVETCDRTTHTKQAPCPRKKRKLARFRCNKPHENYKSNDGSEQITRRIIMQ
jgi:hypothetical protein